MPELVHQGEADSHIVTGTAVRWERATHLLRPALERLAGTRRIIVAPEQRDVAVADEPEDPFTSLQTQRLDDALSRLRSAGVDPPLVHLANSAGGLAHPGTRRSFVRAGIAIYGIEPGPSVRALAAGPGAIILCGRFEGVDQRLIEARDLEEVSIGDYILSGGEPAALVLLDAVVRLLPGVMGNEASGEEESFEGGLLEHPHYTRPQEFEGRPIPEVLTSGSLLLTRTT